MADADQAAQIPLTTASTEAAPWTLAVAASFTAEPLVAPLAWVLSEAALPARVLLAPYHQVFQQLLSPTSLLSSHEGGVNVVLVRLEDYVRDQASDAAAACTIERIAHELLEAVRQFSRKAPSPLLLAILPVSPLARAPLRSVLKGTTAQLLQAIRALAGIHVLAACTFRRLCAGEPYDRQRDELAHIPFSEDYYAALALGIARKAHALRVPAHKVLALDCDNTLWRGVIGEDGVNGIELSEGHLAVQRFATQAQAAGALLCLISKNAERDVLEVFERRPDMVLKLERIIAHRINWKSKPQNIASLARELNLGLDAFVFLDDNPIECAQMQAELPQVVSLQLPEEPRIGSFLDNLWAFDKLAVTSEDTRRTSMYRENLARRACENAAHDIGDFITSLRLQIDIDAPGEDEWPRIAQLTQRTNQFNFTTVRRTEAELRALRQAGTPVLRVRVRDRFGDYGLVGVMLARMAPPGLTVDTLLLSCRVLGRGVEHAMLRRLGELAREHGLSHVDLPYVQTAKNEPARAFADSVAAGCRLDDGQRVLYRIAVTQCCDIQHRPGEDPEAIVQARQAEESKATGAAAGPATGAANRSERYARLAGQYVSGRAVLEALRAHGRRARPLPSEPVRPATDSERQLLQLWQELLNIDELGVEDDYFALGGNSLLTARMFAEIARRFGVRLRLTTILDAPTVRSLALHLRVQGVDRREPLVELKRGGPVQLFLIHDGDGETLLYRNLAQHLPDRIGVWGIEPRRLPGIALAADSVPRMAHDYIEELRRRQPHGPYLLGGLCAGGVIAYEMAHQLQGLGETIQLVVLLDAACPGALKRGGRLARQRTQRFEAMLAQVRETPGSAVTRVLRLTSGTFRKALGLSRWVLHQPLQHLSVRRRFALLRRRLRHRQPWPASIPSLSVREI